MKALIERHKLELAAIGIVVLALVGSVVLWVHKHMYVAVAIAVCGMTCAVLILSFRNSRMVQKGLVVHCPSTLTDALEQSKALRYDDRLGVRSLAYGYVYVCMLIGPMDSSGMPVRVDFAPLAYLYWHLPKEHTVLALIIMADAACPVCGVLYPTMTSTDAPGNYSRRNEPSQVLSCMHWTCRRCVRIQYCSVCGKDVDTRGTMLVPEFVRVLLAR